MEMKAAIPSVATIVVLLLDYTYVRQITKYFVSHPQKFFIISRMRRQW